MISGDTFHNLPFAAAVFDNRGNLLECNSMLKELLGYDEWELIAKSADYNLFNQLCSQNDLEAALENSGQFITEIQLKQKGGPILYILLSVIRIKEKRKKPDKFLGFFQNQTSQKITSAELKTEQFYTKALIDSLPIVLFVYTQDGQLIKWNRHQEMGAGYTDDELKKKPLYSWFPKEDLPKLKRAVVEVFNRGSTSLEARVIMKDGRQVPYLFSGRRLDTDEGNYLLGIGLDISDRKDIEEALKKSQLKYYNLINSGNDGITIHIKGSIVFANNVAQKYMGYKPEEIVGEFITKFIVPEDQERLMKQAQDRAMGKPVPALSQTTLVRKDGSLWPVELHTQLIDYEGQKAHLSFIRDFTERRALEKKLQQATEEAIQANQTKTQFLANVSHEIRTPINTVIGLSDLLAKKVKEPELKDYVESIRTSSQTLLGLINEILDLSKIEAGRMELKPYPTNLEKTFNDVLSIFRHRIHEKGIELESTITGQLPRLVLIDELRFKQVLINLVGNAVKFTESGKIWVKLEAVDDHADYITLLISVKDSGIGIAKKDQERIFEPFAQQDEQDTRKYQGTGLGLSITSRIIQLMNGNIMLESEPGKGSHFMIQLPKIQILKDHLVDSEEFLAEEITREIAASIESQKAEQEEDQELSHKELAEIVSEIDHKLMPEWEQFKGRISIKKAREFSEKLSALGQKYQCQRIIEYSDYVNGSLLSYNIEQLEKTLMEFAKLKDKLTAK
jgi:PAS domain S-box-containing protein